MKIVEWGVKHFKSATFDNVFTIFSIHCGMKYQLPASPQESIYWINDEHQWWNHYTWGEVSGRTSARVGRGFLSHPVLDGYPWWVWDVKVFICFFRLRCEAETESMEIIFTFVWLARKYSNYHNIWKIVMIVWQGKQEESWTRHRYIPYHIIHYTTILFQSHSVGHAMPRIPWQKTLGKGRDQVVPRDKQLGCGSGLVGRGNEYPLIHCTVSTMPTD